MLSDIDERLVGLAKTRIINADIFGESLAFGVDVFFCAVRLYHGFYFRALSNRAANS